MAKIGRAWAAATASDDVRDQPFFVCLASRDHHSVGDSGQTAKSGLDLAELDPIASNLDLSVEPVEILDVPIRTVANPVPRSVDLGGGVGSKRVRNELFGRQGRPIQVSARQAFSADMELARNPDRNRLESRVENVRLHVVDGPADRQLSGIAGLRRAKLGKRRGYRRFGRTVAVQEPGARSRRAEPLIRVVPAELSPRR